MLVQLVDSLLDLMEQDGPFRYFQFDGQTCMLEDYLEIRPENRGRLGKLIKDGRILIGPWYTMPDLFCPDGESLVRNLLMGAGISREWGVSSMPVGFICDMFGHPSQMPQIFAGFGINDVVLGRGTNESTTEMFFDWVGSDGTKSLTYKLQDSLGYGGFAGPRAIFEADSTEALRQIEGYDEFVKALEEAEGNEERNKVLDIWGGNELARYLKHEIERANLPVLAVMDTMDHTIPAVDVERYLNLIRDSLPELEPHHSTLPEFFKDVRAQLDNTKLLQKQGELREPSKESCDYLHLIPNCVSARIPLKIVGDRAASLLQRWADPLIALAQQESAEVQSWRPFLNRAWKQLLLNHAHDSICGCSIDQVHRDMLSRFEQVQVLGEQLRQQALAVLTAGAANLAQNSDEFTLMIYNPVPHARQEAVEFDIDFPTDYPTTFHEGFRSQDVLAFTLEDSEGMVMPYQLLHMSPNMNERSKLARYNHVSSGLFHRYRIAATVALPASGYTSLRVKPSKRPVRNMESMRTGPASAENEFLAVEIADNGTLILTDKQNAQTYRDLLLFEDRSEVGDGWYHGHSVNDMALLSTSTQATVAVKHDGPEMLTFKVEIKLEVPRRYDWHKEEPSFEKGSITICSDISLRRHAQIVDITTTVDNQAEDHRLQLLLPTDVKTANHYVAQTAFDVVERKIALDTNTHNWQEAEVAEKPFESFQAIGHEERGLAFLSAGGLHEGGVRNDKRRTMQVTLLRSFRRTFGTEGERDGLELGETQYRYALMPFSGNAPRTSLINHAQEMQSGLITRQTGARSSGHHSLKKNGVATKSFFKIEGDLAISSLKLAEGNDGTTIIRLWNPSDKVANARVSFERTVTSVEYVGLDEEPLPDCKPLEINNGTIVIRAGAKQIVTLKVSF